MDTPLTLCLTQRTGPGTLSFPRVVPMVCNKVFFPLTPGLSHFPVAEWERPCSPYPIHRSFCLEPTLGCRGSVVERGEGTRRYFSVPLTLPGNGTSELRVSLLSHLRRSAGVEGPVVKPRS